MATARTKGDASLTAPLRSNTAFVTALAGRSLIFLVAALARWIFGVMIVGAPARWRLIFLIAALARQIVVFLVTAPARWNVGVTVIAVDSS